MRRRSHATGVVRGSLEGTLRLTERYTIPIEGKAQVTAPLVTTVGITRGTDMF
ncbi:hypothetical protein GCM10010249_60850 [Streptomyces roseolilacinus]|uniref:Uncharacterized protein n=1 Tax=Streptomyces roseolilacinus TaxID=66904 RepID=A0A918ENQ7_9ACTN|nr:hypothetical protein GCM10010249_60850 [Streptomyces roseolilacinus]